MTVKELYNWCKTCRYKDAEVYLVKDWEDVDEQGVLRDLYRLRNITIQTHIYESGLGWEEEQEALLEVEEERA